MKRLLLLAPLCGLLGFAGTSMARPEASPAPSVSIDDAAWLVGSWEGELFGGFAEEEWSDPVDGAMMGMFRHMKGDKISFYEFFILIEDPEHGLVLRLKHFNADLTGWEEKAKFVEFPLIEAKENELVFDGLVMRLADPNTIEVKLQLDQGAGVQTVEFEYHRVES
jgi:hypothetical protein